LKYFGNGGDLICSLPVRPLPRESGHPDQKGAVQPKWEKNLVVVTITSKMTAIDRG